MHTKIETITPAIAEKYLKHNKSNRPLKPGKVSQYATEMRNNRWGLTHQGIGFYANGDLKDGQHRLNAVIESGVSIEINVTRGIPETVAGNPEIFTMDVIDAGRPRSVADMLSLNHQVKNSCLVASTCRNIASLCAGGDRVSNTMGITMAIMSIYQAEIEAVITATSGFRPLRRAAVIAPIVLAAKIDLAKTVAFSLTLSNGEEVKKGMPVLALRNHLVSHPTPREFYGELICAEWVANALFAHFAGEKLTLIRRGVQGLDYFRSKQKTYVDRIKATIGV